MNRQDENFIFDWRRNRWDYRLPVLIAISLFGHIFCFYIFHVVYPTTTTLLPPSAQVTVLDRNNPRDKSLLEWVEMNDPTNVSAPRLNPRFAAQLMPQYQPFFSTFSAQLKRSDPSEQRERGIPSIFSAETLLPMRSRSVNPVSSKTFPSRLDISSTLRPREPASLPALPTSSMLSEPTSIFVGINALGEVDFVFLRQSGGNGALDRKAEQFIRSVKFQPGPGRDWGVITLHWGGTQP